MHKYSKILLFFNSNGSKEPVIAAMKKIAQYSNHTCFMMMKRASIAKLPMSITIRIAYSGFAANVVVQPEAKPSIKSALQNAIL